MFKDPRALLLGPRENFSFQDFELGKMCDYGSYSKVARAKKTDKGMVYAMKIVDKKFFMKENKTRLM